MKHATPFNATLSILLILSLGCVGTLEEPDSNGTTPTPIQTTPTNNTTTPANNGATTPSTNNATTPANNATTPGLSDMGATTPGEEDMGNATTPIEEDMGGGTTPPVQDMGPPPLQNPCDNGPLSAPIANCRPAPYPSTGDFKEDCVQRINQLRWECQCLPPLQRWTEGESCADQQAAHDASTNTPHDGFNSRICSPSGFGQNECPNYGTPERAIGTCLQQMWDEGPGENFQEHGHYINMTSDSFSKVACGEGGGWYLMNFQ
ncbi:MAG: hypothetical protein VYE40_12750 [Myxococcota bacterium]|jgi:hypothetical protein|nr:hypothetical protein [Myxococcota bacterium]